MGCTMRDAENWPHHPDWAWEGSTRAYCSYSIDAPLGRLRLMCWYHEEVPTLCYSTITSRQYMSVSILRSHVLLLQNQKEITQWYHQGVATGVLE